MADLLFLLCFCSLRPFHFPVRLRGGGIELAILADFWDIEIAALDVESCHQYVFGQSEDAGQQKSKRIYLVYYVRPLKGAPCRARVSFVCVSVAGGQ